MNNKSFLIQRNNGKQEWVLIRQEPHDPQYKLGSRIPRLGEVIRVKDQCAMCGESYEDHQPASGNSAPLCRSLSSRFGDTYIREGF